MVEKFSEFESAGFLDREGKFNFEIKSAELRDSSKGTPMVVLEAEAPEGKTTLYHSLSPKARWSYNNLIKCCLNLDTPEKIQNFMCDYETIGQDLVGKHFMGEVECQQYTKTVKTLTEDGTYVDKEETRDSYKIVHYDFVR